MNWNTIKCWETWEHGTRNKQKSNVHIWCQRLMVRDSRKLDHVVFYVRRFHEITGKTCLAMVRALLHITSINIYTCSLEIQIHYWMCQSVNSRAVRLLPRPNMYVSAMIQIAYCFMKCCQFKMCTRTTFADVNGILGFVHFAKTPCVYALANIRYTWWLLSILLLLLLNVWNNNNYILCAYRTCATMPGHIFCTNVLNSIQPDASTHSQCQPMPHFSNDERYNRIVTHSSQSLSHTGTRMSFGGASCFSRCCVEMLK